MDPSPPAHRGFSSLPDPHALAVVIQGSLSLRAICQSAIPQPVSVLLTHSALDRFRSLLGGSPDATCWDRPYGLARLAGALLSLRCF